MGLQATAIRDMLYAAATYGEAYDTLREMAGFTQEEISDSGQMVEWQKAAKLYDLLADITHNEQIGLVMGGDVSMAITGMVGFLMQASKNLEDAIGVYCRYGQMVCPMITYTYRREGKFAVVELHQNALWKSTYPRNARIAIDFVLSSTLHFIRGLCGRSIYPQAVEVEYAKDAVKMYQEVLHCQVLFNAPLHRMLFLAEDMHTPVTSSDASLFELFSNILGQKKSLAIQSSCRDAVKHLLLMQHKGQIPTIEDAASGLEMTVRTLQRKLTAEQTSFREIAAEVKKELALHLMKNRTGTITEVAEVLGYNDLPAFRRAFKLWTRSTPKVVKKQLVNG
ncbi:AraC family transcriptional regulator [Niabella drilacis]|uniref:AraC-type DNA-binding protein n=1 Tax=Niabella drilacis (strain DSM 25811 / CCM 8410 / CCUG 62505 / LMG 26954 / E90) TaxID=1285928 RepID=A0A1G6ILG0_NIADE|nr:AraC family transcriptional regulator [Niabella drilacis]SDC07338.1 AraC-type DNA-binding protein [Niabella drilacis]